MQKLELSKLLSLCVKCGGCKAQCPSYFVHEQETQTARGRLRVMNALLNGQLTPNKKSIDIIYSCLMCGKCSLQCPLGIDLQNIFYSSREYLRKSDKERARIRFLTKLAFKNTNLAVKLYKPFNKLLHKGLEKRRLIPKDIEICQSPFNKTGVFRPKEKKGRVAVFMGCTVKHIYPELAFSLAHVLTSLHYEVVFPHGEKCCGIPFRSLGMTDKAKKFAKKNYELFSKLNVEAIISLCPTCVDVLKYHYLELIGHSFNNVFEVSTFLIDKIKTPRNDIDLTVTYHDPCHCINLLKTTSEPRKILEILGIKLIEPSRQTCCGFAGTFSFFYKKASEAILEDTCNELKKTGAKFTVTSCPNCIFQLSKSISSKSIYHIIEIIEEALVDNKSLLHNETMDECSISGMY
ncbi:Fe-S oxidoreductase [Candidatus Magnetoovum chiemensis]|nr:Fe-S oxidoreductase [Candidatus Magnetoovum chiemensis]